MKAELTIIPKISIHPGKINIYNEMHWSPAKPTYKGNDVDSALNFDKDGNIIDINQERIKHIINSKRKSNGIVSKNAAKKMTTASEYLLLLAGKKTMHNRSTGKTFQFKIAFITLTIPSAQIHDDKEIINKSLNQFLIEIKKYYKVRNYIWRAEKQKNGNIHFHILIDKFIPYQELRDRWNRIINKLGYVDRYRDEQKKWHSKGFKPRPELYPTWSKEKQFRAYLRGSRTHWASPNSTDIHSVKKIQNLKAYITKYMTKTEGQFNITGTQIKIPIYQTGRIWGCNRDLNKITGARSEIDSILENELQQLIDADNVYKFNSDYFTVIYFDYRELELNGLDALFKLFSRYMFSTFGHAIQSQFAA